MVLPQVSILIPVYNRQEFIRPCIDSALEQSAENFEVVVCDNASTDATWEVLQEYTRLDSRIRIFRNKQNLGPVRNWMRCIREAKGPVGKLLFSDDTLAPDYLSKTLPLLEDDVGFVFTSTKVGPRRSEGRLSYSWRETTGWYRGTEFIHDSLFNGDTPVSPGCALFRLADLKKNLKLDIPSRSSHDFSGHGAGPDLLLFLLAADAYPRVGFVAEPLAFFRSHEGSFSVGERRYEIQEAYRQARVWFAERHLAPRIANRFKASLWLRELGMSREYKSPTKYLSQYTDDTCLPVLLLAAGSIKLKRVKSRILEYLQHDLRRK